MPRLELFLLGAPRIERDGTPVAVDRRKAIALLAYLAVTGQHHNREALAALFWPEYDQSRASAYLRRALWEANQAAGDGWIEAGRETISLNRPPGFWLDTAEFQRLCAQARAHAHPGAGGCPDCLQRLSEAVALYRDDFLAGFTLRDSPGFDDWQFFQAETLRAECASALDQLAHWQSAEGMLEGAIASARRRVALDPLHEPAHRQLMALYAQAGQRSAALRQYQECVRLLAEELGGVPQPETTALYERIRTGELEPGSARRGHGAAEEQRIVPGPASLRYSVPAPSTPFVGREAELAAITKLLADPACRLLTLGGPGGIGKTRLALEAAARHSSGFANGAAFVPLAPLASAEFILSAVASALQLSVSGQDEKAQLLAYLRERELLLVMDNFEHLVEGAELLAEILASASGVKLLVTSRERLNLQAEWLFDVGGLAYPPSSGTWEGAARRVEEFAAVQLFIQSARRARATFILSAADRPAVARICALLEGMPLGVELAAAWVRSLSCDQIAAELEQRLDLLSTTLRDVPQRHRSVRSVFDQSWDLLPRAECDVLRRLAVFRGGFTREAAAEVANASLAILSALVDKSLLRATAAGRYEMHELLRQYAYQKLLSSGETEATRRHHLDFFLQMAEEAEPKLLSLERVAWSNRLDAEIDNLRAALEYALASGAAERTLRLAGVLRWFWFRGYLSEGREWLEAALAGAGETASPRARALALAASGTLALNQSDYALALARFEQSADIWRELEDRAGLADALSHLGVVAEWWQGDYATARRLQEESAALYREAGNRRGLGFALNNLAGATLGLGDVAAARSLFEEALTLFRELGEKPLLPLPLLGLGGVALRRGDHAAAHSLYSESAALSREVGDKHALAWSLSLLGEVALQQGDVALAAARYRESLLVARDTGFKMTIDPCLAGLGETAHHQGRPARAARLLAAASLVNEATGSRESLAGRRQAPIIAAVRAQLGEGAFAEAWARGRAMGIERAIAYALAEDESEQIDI